MNKLSRLLVGLAVVLMGGMIPMVAAQGEDLPEDCVAYLEARDEAVEAVNEAFQTGVLIDALRLVVETRYAYLTMEEVPECATTLHDLFIDGLAANGDILIYYVALTDDSRAFIEETIRPYLDGINEEIDAELEALGWPHD